MPILNSKASKVFTGTYTIEPDPSSLLVTAYPLAKAIPSSFSGNGSPKMLTSCSSSCMGPKLSPISLTDSPIGLSTSEDFSSNIDDAAELGGYDGGADNAIELGGYDGGADDAIKLGGYNGGADDAIKLGGYNGGGTDEEDEEDDAIKLGGIAAGEEDEENDEIRADGIVVDEEDGATKADGIAAGTLITTCGTRTKCRAITSVGILPFAAMILDEDSIIE
jgi:hypothetical protein